jgi:C-terminal processing protease CtpA/Prc
MKTATQAPADFVDAMDESNHVAVALPKPMGIVFEENDEDFGGIFVQSIKEGGVADKSGVLMEGDQLVLVGNKPVHGLPFDDALGAIVDAEGEKVKIVLFRGGAKQFYGPTGASKEWLKEFVEKGGVEVSE